MEYMPYTIAVYIEKGGVTKTTTTVHLAQACARKGLHVLVIDVDAQSHASRWLLNVDPELTLNDAVRSPEQLRSCIIASRVPGVDVLPGSRKLALVAESVLKQDEEGNPRNAYGVLKNLLAGLSEYDLILIDCSPSVSMLNSNAIVAADLILVPTDLADMGFDGITRLALTLAQMVRNGLLDRVPALAVLLTLVESKTSRTTTSIRDRIAAIGARENAPYTVLSNTIRYRTQMKGIFDQRATAFELVDGGAFKWSNLKAITEDYNSAATEIATMVVAARSTAAAT
jgi:chromosome partitioning protein